MLYITKNDIAILLSKMTNNFNLNIEKIRKTFDSLEYKDYENQSILHILVDDKYNEDGAF